MKETFVKLAKITGLTILGLFVFSILMVLIYRWVPVPFTPLMIIRVGEQIAKDKEVKLKKDWVSLDEISGNLQIAVVSSEDQNFLYHSGFDFEAIQKALEHNKKKKKVRGASTISQQTAKNTFLWPGRTWFRKGLEVYFTFMIELMWPKERIMEVYLNIIEVGDGIYGAEAGSQIFFHHAAKNITTGEAALIAAVLPSPRRFSVTSPSNYVNKRKNWILRQMNNNGGVLDYTQTVKPVLKTGKQRRR